MRKDKPEPETITLVVKGVTGEARYLFNAMSAGEAGSYTRGEVMSQIIRATAKNYFGNDLAQRFVDGYHAQQQELKKQDGPT